MKILGMAFIAIVLSLGINSATFAQTKDTKTPVINKRQNHQKDRIKQGVKSGEMTEKETAKAARDQKEIRQEEREAKADGDVTAKERTKIQHKQNQANRKIYRSKHNNKDRN
jgi:uncharacterized protein HemX